MEGVLVHMAAPRPLPEAPFLQPPASRGRLGWAFGVSSRFPVRSLLHRATTPSVSVVTFGGGGSGPGQRVSRDRVGLGVGPCAGKGRGGVPTRAPPPRLPFVVGESCPWPRPRLGLIPPPSQGRRSVRQMPSEGTDECHAQTAVRAGDPSRPLRLGHWGHRAIGSRHSSWPSTRAAVSVRTPPGPGQGLRPTS